MMATPIMSNLTENEARVGNVKGAATVETGPKFAFQDRSNMVKQKSVNGRGATPKKVFGGRQLPLSLWQENKDGKKRDRVKQKDVSSKSFEISGDENVSEGESPKAAEIKPLNFNREVEEIEPELEMDMDFVDDLGFDDDDVPPQEKLNPPLDADYDYYSTMPSPTSLRYSDMIRTDEFLYEGVPDFECDSPYVGDDSSSFLWGSMSPARSVDLTFSYNDDSNDDGRSSGFADVAFLDYSNSNS